MTFGKIKDVHYVSVIIYNQINNLIIIIEFAIDSDFDILDAAIQIKENLNSNKEQGEGCDYEARQEQRAVYGET